MRKTVVYSGRENKKGVKNQCHRYRVDGAFPRDGGKTAIEMFFSL